LILTQEIVFTHIYNRVADLRDVL